MLDKLRALQKQASPGPWRVVKTDVKGVANYVVLSDSDANLSLRASDLYEADAQLAALATHLLPLAEALERAKNTIHTGICNNVHLTGHAGCTERCKDANKALKALTEALDGSRN